MVDPLRMFEKQLQILCLVVRRSKGNWLYFGWSISRAEWIRHLFRQTNNNCRGSQYNSRLLLISKAGDYNLMIFLKEIP